MLHLHELPARILPAWLAIPGTSATVRVDGGSLGITDGAGGWVREPGPVFEERFTGDVSAAIRGDRVYVGAGVGGGPRAVAIDWHTGAVVASEYLGDPDSRQGVDVAGVLRLTAVPGDGPIVVPEPVVAWDPGLPNSYGFGPVRVELVPAGWVGTDNDAVGLVYDVFVEIANRLGDSSPYTVGWGLKEPGIYVRLLPGMTAADVVSQIIGV